MADSRAERALQFLEEWVSGEQQTLADMEAGEDPLSSHTDTACYYLELLEKAAAIVEVTDEERALETAVVLSCGLHDYGDES